VIENLFWAGACIAVGVGAGRWIQNHFPEQKSSAEQPSPAPALVAAVGAEASSSIEHSTDVDLLKDPLSLRDSGIDISSLDSIDFSTTPSVNIDVTPMCSDIDDLNPTSAFDDTDFSSRPSVNIDGTPMCGDLDINGNPFGCTSSHDWD